MHLSHAECERFYRLMDVVVSYAVDIEGFTQNEEKQALDLSGEPVAPEQELDHDVLAYVSHDPGFMRRLFERASRDMPGYLDARDRRILRSWQEGAWETTAILMDFTSSGNALLYTPMGVVELSGISQDIDGMAFLPPCPVMLVFLPFGERIVYATSIVQYPVELGPGILGELDGELAKIESGEARPIASASAYLKRVKAQKERERERDFAELERSLDREARKAAGEEALPRGVHRGALVGLDEAERERAVHEDMDRVISDMAHDIEEFEREELEESAIEGTPRKDLRAALECLECDPDTGEVYALSGLSLLLGDIDGWDEERDGYLATSEVGAKAAEMPDVLKALLVLCDQSAFSLIERVREAGGELTVSAGDAEALKAINVLPPITFLYRDPAAATFAVVIHEPVRKLLEELDWDALRKERAFIDEVIRYAERACELYGVLTMEAFAEEFGKATGWKGEASHLFSLLDNVCIFRDRDIVLDGYGRQAMLVAYEISDEWLEEAGADEEDIADARRWRHVLLERQETIPRRPLSEAMGEPTLFHWLMKRESARLLRAWLDAHVPDGKNDYAFADGLMEELFDSANQDMSPSEQARIVTDPYGEVDFSSEDEVMDFFNELLALAMRYVNDVPQWYDHGYSPGELHELETGRKLFFNEDGTVMKVGRNDPCPCGSGKKYKHCHGRRR